MLRYAPVMTNLGKWDVDLLAERLLGRARPGPPAAADALAGTGEGASEIKLRRLTSSRSRETQV